MSESGQGTSGNWWKTPLLHLLAKVQQREDQVFLVLTLIIGALTGLAVVAFILLTERLGMRDSIRRELRRGDVCCSQSWAPWVSDICCFAIFPTREAAEYNRPKLCCMHAKATSCCAPCWENSSARM